MWSELGVWAINGGGAPNGGPCLFHLHPSIYWVCIEEPQLPMRHTSCNTWLMLHKYCNTPRYCMGVILLCTHQPGITPMKCELLNQSLHPYLISATYWTHNHPNESWLNTPQRKEKVSQFKLRMWAWASVKRVNPWKKNQGIYKKERCTYTQMVHCTLGSIRPHKRNPIKVWRRQLSLPLLGSASQTNWYHNILGIQCSIGSVYLLNDV